MSDTARKSLSLLPGKIVRTDGVDYRILEILDFDTVVAVDLESGRSRMLSIEDLAPVGGEPAPAAELAAIADDDWRKAHRRYAAIEPLLRDGAGRTDVSARAEEVGVSAPTLYRWLRRYRESKSLEALIPGKRGMRKGEKRISGHAEEIIRDVIETSYLTIQRPSAQKVVQEVRRRCLERGLAKIPHANTIRARIAEINERDRLRKRGYKEKAKNKYLPTPGSFPHADYPLSVVEIDHTRADIILVDDRRRQPIGRPWVTLAIDVHSRMVTGYYLAFDPPSATSVAMCVAHSILPKKEWLVLHGVEAEWPVWGVMDVIHVDNGSDFRSETFRNACMSHGIRLEYRPVRQPRYGGHIERLIGTFMKEVHGLPGSTFSSIKEREGYDPEKRAAMTLGEFEKWLVGYICTVYHKRLHKGIGMTPEKKWERGIFGDGKSEGRGVPALPANPQNLLIDFLPMFRRTVQNYGIRLDGLTYYADVLRSWINAENPETPGKKREFIVRRDPRDISSIWFHDPEAGRYYRIPFANQAMPAASLWEYRQAAKQARAEGMKSFNEHRVLQALADLRREVDEAAARTKKARRQQQRRKEHKKKVTPAAPLPPDARPAADAPRTPPDLEDPGNLGDFDIFGDIA